jgi:hypothetical protein
MVSSHRRLMSDCGAENEAIVTTPRTTRMPAMKAFVLIVTFATAGATGDKHTARIANFDDYQSCAAAGRSLYAQQHWECVPANQAPQDGAKR